MDTTDSWRELAAAHRSVLLAEFARETEGLELTSEQITEHDQLLRARANRAGLKSWAPLDVCAFYLSVTAREASLSERSGYEMEKLRSLVTAWQMEAVWAEVSSCRIGSLSFAINITDLAARFDGGVYGWLGQPPGERDKKAEKISELAQELALKLGESPAAFTSLFYFIPEQSAERIATHCMRHPAHGVHTIPPHAGAAIESALPAHVNMREALTALAKQAEKWKGGKQLYGRSDRSQWLRAFVKELCASLEVDKNPHLLKSVVDPCCNVLFKTQPELSQLKSWIA